MGLAVAGAAAYFVVSELFLEPPEVDSPFFHHFAEPALTRSCAGALARQTDRKIGAALLGPQAAVFNAALARLKDDPRVLVRLGPAASITGYGADSRSRSARQARERERGGGKKREERGTGDGRGRRWERNRKQTT